MRNTLLAVVAFILAVISPLVQERYMSTAPEYVFRWVALAFVVLGIAFLVLSDWSYSYVFDGGNRGLAVLVVTVAAGVAAGSTYWFLIASRPPTLPIRVRVSAVAESHPAGTVVAGIVWSEKYSTLRVRFDNATKQDFTDLDLLIRPDAPIAKIAQMTSVPGITFEDNAGMDLSALWKGKTVGTLTPANMEMLATSNGYRVIVDRLKANSHVEVIAAIVTIASEKDILRVNMADKAPPRHESAYWFRSTLATMPALEHFGNAVPAKETLLRGTYQAGGKQHDIEHMFYPASMSSVQVLPTP